MKAKVLFLFFCVGLVPLRAIDVVPHEDSINYFSWTLSEKLGEPQRVNTDTLALNFPNYTLTEGNGASKAAIASIGSPMYERIFERREEVPDFLFLNVFSDYVYSPSKFHFQNNKTPCMNVWYQTAGGSRKKEERLKISLSMNANKKFNFGGNFDYIYSRGFYANQRVRQINYNFFTSYNSDRYQLHAYVFPFNIQNYENGGITNDLYISDPASVEGKSSYDSRNVPTHFSSDVANKNTGVTAFLSHRYNLGFYKEVVVPRDTTQKAEQENKDTSSLNPLTDSTQLATDTLPETIEVFVPVSSIVHTFHLVNATHEFIGNGLPTDLYPTRYFGQDSVLDKTSCTFVRNTLALSLREGFNKYAKAGLSFFANVDVHKYRLLDNNLQLSTTDESTVSLGAKISKEQGRVLTYDAYGEVALTGEHSGETTLKGTINTSFPLGKERVSVRLFGQFLNRLPNFYYRHYHGTCFWWDNDFQFERRLRLGFNLSLKRFDCGIRGVMENISNYVYLDSIGAQQHSEAIQVLSVTAYKNLKFGVFHWDNELSWQQSSVSSVLPLPKFTIYSNMYILTKMQKVLTFQFGIDCRYYTKYYAPAYEPTLGQFRVQDEMEIGNYPLINVYLNLHLKYTRFYVMYYNAGAGLISRDYFVAPHYPMNPSGIRFGLSVNFYN